MSESTSDDLAEFWAAQTRPGAKCPIPALIDSLPPERGEKLRRALAVPPDRLQHAAITAVLGGWGIEISRDSIGRHRRQICKCPKT